jgi:L-alanine-DL-glutamate epimerase-like enolase superfamily enzyme
MKITGIETFLVNAAPLQDGGWAARNWLFVKVHTDAGI